MHKTSLLFLVCMALSSCGNLGSYLGSPVICAENVQLNKENVSLTVSGKEQLFAKVLPQNAADQTIHWTASSPSVASIDSTGIITGISPGETVITAKSIDGEISANCKVTVYSTEIVLEKISLTEKSLSLAAGTEKALTAEIQPSNATNQNLSWISSNTDIIEVSPDGTVSAKNSGIAVITVTAYNGKTDLCEIEVSPAAIPVTDVTLNKTALSYSIGRSETLIGYAKPLNATNSAVSWSSSSPEIAEVSGAGTVTTKAPGTAVITVKTKEGSFFKICTVTVTGYAAASITVSGSTTEYRLPGGSVFKTVKAPHPGEALSVFPTQTDDSKKTAIPDQFTIGETETTYALWKEVLEWATDPARGSLKYRFASAGQNGDDLVGKSEPYTYPATKVSWRDAIVWSNALTEYINTYNGSAEDAEYVYYSDISCSIPYRSSVYDELSSSVSTDAGSIDQPYIRTGAKGFRLPSSTEWEFAARYIGTAEPSNINTVFSNGVYYTNGKSASGADSLDIFAAMLTAVCETDYIVGVKCVTRVKTKRSNQIGLYDMSGNVKELCFDWCPLSPSIYRVTRGGTAAHNASGVAVGLEGAISPYTAISDTGFRIAGTY